MKKKQLTLWIMIIAILTVMVIPPTHGEAASISEQLKQVQDQLKKAEREVAEAKRKAANAKNEAAATKNEKKDYESLKKEAQESINRLMAEIDNVVINKTKTEADLKAKEAQLLQTEQDLLNAEERVAKRDELLQSRMRLMYTNGAVSYLDVLLSATSFTDFLDRFDALQTMLGQDKVILAEQKAEKELVITKKAELEQQLTEVKAIYEQLGKYQEYLISKEQDKERLITSYNSSIKQLDNKLVQIDSTLEELEVISKEQEKLLIALAAQEVKLKKVANPYKGGKLGMPIIDYSRVSSEFGTRIHPITKKRHTHTGTDFAAPQGTDIFAAEAGNVIVAQGWSGYGNTVIIDHGNGLWTLYAHIRNNGIKVEKGDTVKKGQKIAEVGSTGNSTGPHLHFEVRKDEVPVNPSGYLK